jgi:60 kDa SS-A/Ro ribonucleoprotein
MSRTNVRIPTPGPQTHEGAPAARITAEQELRRSVMACMLWEDTFYEDGESIVDRIVKTVKLVDPAVASAIAIEARTNMNIRHASLLIARALAYGGGPIVSRTIEAVIQRADELAEFLSLYWIGAKKHTLSAQVRKGLARAFGKFDAYALAKYNREGAVRLRDVLFLSHAKPKDEAQALLWKQLIAGTLPIPETWEVALSAGKDKKRAFTDLIEQKKLGGLALLRNLRNMQQVGVEDTVIREAISAMNVNRILPFRFITAARYAPSLEDALEGAMFRRTEALPKIPGEVTVLVDVSGSMTGKLSDKSDLRRVDAAAALAAIVREMSNRVNLVLFHREMIDLPPRRGFALIDMITQACKSNQGTYLGRAIRTVTEKWPEALLIAITDEQSEDTVAMIPGKRRAYMLNVGNYEAGTGYSKPNGIEYRADGWSHFDGFSDSIVRYIVAAENLAAPYAEPEEELD